MADMIQQIRDSYPSFPNAKKTVASFFLNHFEQLQFLTVTELAEKIGVSDTTIINFCKDLGYDGYAEVKRTVRETVQKSESHRKDSEPNKPDCLANLLYLAEKNLRDTFDDPENITAIEQAVRLIRKAKHVYAIGFWRNGCAARDLCLDLRYQKKKAEAIIPDLGDYIDKILLINSDELAIIYDFRYYLAALTEICVLLKKQQVPIVLITDMGSCPRASYADVLIRCHVQSFSTGVPYLINKALILPLEVQRKDDYDTIREGVFSRFNDYGILECSEGKNEHI